MKIFSLATIAAVSLCGLSISSGLAQAAFPKDSKVRLRKDTPLLFKAELARIGKTGEIFTVIQHNSAAKRVFVLATDAAGKQIALSVSEDAVEYAPFDLAGLRAVVLPLAEKGDVKTAAAAMAAAAVKAPNDVGLQRYLSAVLAAKAAQDRVSAAVNNTEQVKRRIAELSKNAWAVRNNPIDPQGGFARSQQMKADAERLEAAANKENEEAKGEWDAAQRRLVAVLNDPESTIEKVDAGGVRTTVTRSTSVAPGSNVGPAPGAAARKSEYTQMFEKLVPDGADTLQADRLEKGKRYRHYGYIFQVTNDMLLVDKMGARDEPWAMLVFADPKKMEGISIEPKGWVQAIVEFAGFKSVQMSSGAEKRLAVFKCIGFENSDTGHYVDCSAEGAEPAPPKAP